MKSIRNRRAATTIEYVIVFGIGLILLPILGGVGFAIIGGMLDRATATKELAVEFLAELNIQNASLACQGYDTDADGYISCTYTLQGKETLHSIECAPGWVFKGNCRAQRLVVPQPADM